MDLGLRGKVALVVAASQGLGRAIAGELAAFLASERGLRHGPVDRGGRRLDPQPLLTK